METTNKNKIEREKEFIFIDYGVLDSLNSVINALELQIIQLQGNKM
jgi:hypothetical protein